MLIAMRLRWAAGIRAFREMMPRVLLGRKVDAVAVSHRNKQDGLKEDTEMNLDYETGKWIEQLVANLDARLQQIERKVMPELFRENVPAPSTNAAPPHR